MESRIHPTCATLIPIVPFALRLPSDRIEYPLVFAATVAAWKPGAHSRSAIVSSRTDPHNQSSDWHPPVNLEIAPPRHLRPACLLPRKRRRCCAILARMAMVSIPDGRHRVAVEYGRMPGHREPEIRAENMTRTAFWSRRAVRWHIGRPAIESHRSLNVLPAPGPATITCADLCRGQGLSASCQRVPNS